MTSGGWLGGMTFVQDLRWVTGWGDLRWVAGWDDLHTGSQVGGWVG